MDNLILNGIAINDKMNLSFVEMERYMAMKRKEILSNHTKSIMRLRSGKYEGCYQTFVNTASGKRRVLRAPTRQELDDKLVDFYSGHMDDIKHTIDCCFNEWIEYLRINKKPSTVHSYSKVYERHFESIKKKYVEDLSGFDIKLFCKKEVSEKKLSRKAYSSMKIVLRGIFHYAKDRYGIEKNIDTITSDLGRELKGSFYLSKKSLKKDKDLIFFDDEIEMFKKYCNESGTLVDLGILLIFYCGLRVGELVAITKADISEDFKTISITKTEERIEDGSYIIMDMPKTEAGVRNVLLTEEGARILKRIYDLSDKNNEYLFSDEKLGRYIAKKFRDRVYRLCKIFDIPKRSPHDIRRTYASKLRESGVSDRIIIQQMGHVSFDITKEYYIYNRKHKDQVLAELENALV